MVLSMAKAAANSVFRALADPTRRALFDAADAGWKEATRQHALTARSGVSQPAVSKHLTVLKRARLVNQRREGREMHGSAQPKSLAPLVDWMAFYGVFWRDKFSRFGRCARTRWNGELREE